MARGDTNQPTIVIRKVKKRGHAQHHGGAWKVAYADFVTALMAFFMLLWLLGNPDKEQLKGLAEYFAPDSAKSASATTLTSMPGNQPGIGGHSRPGQSSDTKAVGVPSAEAGTEGVSRGGTANVPEAALRVMAQEMRVALEDGLSTDDAGVNLSVEPSRDGYRIHLIDNAKRPMFQGSTAELNDYARNILGRAARKLSGTGAQIVIEGHTDSVGGSNAANWDLSARRALAARNAMVAAGLPEDRFTEVVAKAGTEPIYPDRPESPENRRITIIVVAEPSALPNDPSFKF